MQFFYEIAFKNGKDNTLLLKSFLSLLLKAELNANELFCLILIASRTP